MEHSLLFLPDISGFTKFVQNTEVEHSQHVISELLELLIDSNEIGLELAEIEGDALFFYKENDLPGREALLGQMEKMFTAFHGHLKMMEQYRICNCRACATAPELELKIVAHCGPLTYLKVHGNRKPFGEQVIQAHRLLKNSLQSSSYALMTNELAGQIDLNSGFSSTLFAFEKGVDTYDNQEVHYFYSEVDVGNLDLPVFSSSTKVKLEGEPQLTQEGILDIDADQLLEFITNFRFRHHWVEGVDRFEYKENQVNREGTEHTCIVKGKSLEFVTVTKEVEEGKLVYGELTLSPPPIDELYQFYIIEPISEERSLLKLEVYWKAKSPLKKVAMALIGKRLFQKNLDKAFTGLRSLIAVKDEILTENQMVA